MSTEITDVHVVTYAHICN